MFGAYLNLAPLIKVQKFPKVQNRPTLGNIVKETRPSVCLYWLAGEIYNKFRSRGPPVITQGPPTGPVSLGHPANTMQS